jgi:hypothetical protein
MNRTKREARTTNTDFASGGVTCPKGRALCFYSSSVQVDSFVLRNPPERKARKRYVVFNTDRQVNFNHTLTNFTFVMQKNQSIGIQ